MTLQSYVGRWFAVQVKPKWEYLVSTALTGKGYESYLPTYTCRRRWADRVRNVRHPLFPGYVFCRFDADVNARVVTTPGVVRLVGIGRVPLAVEDREIQALKTIEESGAAVAPWPQLQLGDVVRIMNGPLRGLEGVLHKVNKRDHFVVAVNVLQRSALVELKQEWVASAAGR